VQNPTVSGDAAVCRSTGRPPRGAWCRSTCRCKCRQQFLGWIAPILASRREASCGPLHPHAFPRSGPLARPQLLGRYVRLIFVLPCCNGTSTLNGTFLDNCGIWPEMCWDSIQCEIRPLLKCNLARGFEVFPHIQSGCNRLSVSQIVFIHLLLSVQDQVLVYRT
jgi:hypothetical protein